MKSKQGKGGGHPSGDKHPSWKGGVEYRTKDCIYVNVGCRMRVRRPRKIYEENFGSIPAGHIIIHKDNDRYNDEPSNLKAITRAQHIKRNRNLD